MHPAQLIAKLLDFSLSNIFFVLGFGEIVRDFIQIFQDLFEGVANAIHLRFSLFDEGAAGAVRLIAVRLPMRFGEFTTLTRFAVFPRFVVPMPMLLLPLAMAALTLRMAFLVGMKLPLSAAAPVIPAFAPPAPASTPAITQRAPAPVSTAWRHLPFPFPRWGFGSSFGSFHFRRGGGFA